RPSRARAERRPAARWRTFLVNAFEAEMNTVCCPSCEMTLTVLPHMRGRGLRCPGCKHQFRVAPETDAHLGAATYVASEAIRPAVQPQQSMPQQIGRFQIRERLGSGGFGTVYRAYDPQLDREVALKVPLPGTLDDPARRERFLRGARAA